MEKYRIINFLSTNGLTEIEEVSSEDNRLALKFYYDFEDVEIQGAKASSPLPSTGERTIYSFLFFSPKYILATTSNSTLFPLSSLKAIICFSSIISPPKSTY